jgi:hypothetical protein
MQNIEIAAIVAVCTLVAIISALYFLKHRIRDAEVKTGKISAKLRTHDPDRLVVDGVSQKSVEDGNEAKLRTANATIKNFKQESRKKNVLDIGNE